MKKYEENNKTSKAEEPVQPMMRTFSSQEEAERFNMIAELQKSDMEKFHSFCNMLRMQQIYRRAKIYDMKDISK
ncbi:MAG TPA: hypothetical protein VF487_09210 [Chitinophagaceae bacterium]